MISICTWMIALERVAIAAAPPHVGEVPSERLYKRMDDDGGPARGRWRQRRSGAYLAWELEDKTILRYQKTERRQVVLDRRFDATGWPLTSLETPIGGLPRVVVHSAPSREIVLSGWSSQPIPGGSVSAPLPGLPREGGGVRFLVLGGELEVWHDPRWADVYSDTFRDGLLAGCGCVLVDEMSAWIDNVPGKRFRMEVPGTEPPDQLDVWVVPLGPPPELPRGEGEAPEAGPSGLWLASYRVTAPEVPVLQLAPGRAMMALITLDRLEELVVPVAETPPPPDPLEPGGLPNEGGSELPGEGGDEASDEEGP
ncbi:MAG TPA: hypothetical protein ENK18_02955 [Deltaproteobacteria bacterium]|nr:hypothetical protein [Deltaproteobacteria bacterium]